MCESLLLSTHWLHEERAHTSLTLYCWTIPLFKSSAVVDNRMSTSHVVSSPFCERLMLWASGVVNSLLRNRLPEAALGFCSRGCCTHPASLLSCHPASLPPCHPAVACHPVEVCPVSSDFPWDLTSKTWAQCFSLLRKSIFGCIGSLQHYVVLFASVTYAKSGVSSDAGETENSYWCHSETASVSKEPNNVWSALQNCSRFLWIENNPTMSGYLCWEFENNPIMSGQLCWHCSLHSFGKFIQLRMYVDDIANLTIFIQVLKMFWFKSKSGFCCAFITAPCKILSDQAEVVF